MNIGFWSCIILVIPFLIIGVLFAIFKEKQQNLFQDLIHFLKKNRHCMIKHVLLEKFSR